MLVVRSRLENRQAIVSIGVQRFGQSDMQTGLRSQISSRPIIVYNALIDTGAQRTCLTAKAISSENLVSHGKRPIKNVHNENLHRLYMVQLGFWCDENEVLGPQETNRSYFGFPNMIEVINIADNDFFDAIIGMDVLENFDFHFSKCGNFEIKLG